MLVLTRKLDEGVVITGNIVIRVLGVQSGRVRPAPKNRLTPRRWAVCSVRPRQGVAGARAGRAR